MPVGGDVTQFSLGLMAFLQRSYGAGRLPIWNPLWGFGFPGLAESQMGVYYPPHWLFYGLLPLEWAYTSSLVFHTFWGGLGAYWAARRFEATPAGALLAGFCWAASGFFLIHIPHQWAYTVGSWMPWALGLAWTLNAGRNRLRTWLLLVLVLTLQVLPGHFQLAFCTQVGAILIACGGLGRTRESQQRLLLVLLAIAATLPLGALQLWPTFRLARLAEARRDFEYLSGFAVSPLHLVSYFAPGLFHNSPLWRRLAWDPFHTSPEEYLGYVGLVPLFLAGRMVWAGGRRDPATRALAVLALGTLFFSLGPYAPGFRLWSRVPGFSFFRCPARWTLATELAVCFLAARGLDASRTWPRVGWSLAKFAGMSAILLGLLLLMIELALASTDRSGWPSVASAFQQGMNLLPWSHVQETSSQGEAPQPRTKPEPTFRELMALARQPQNDARIPTALARQGEAVGRPSDWKFASRRGSIYQRGLVGTGILLAGLIALGFCARRETLFRAGLVVFSLVDLLILGQQRPFDLGPIRPLTEQSPILARLAAESSEGRTVDSLRNLPMVAGAAPVSAYRTLDLPILTALTERAQSAFGDAETTAALQAVGAAVRVLDPSETAIASTSGKGLNGWHDRETVVDPVLAGWLSGMDWVKLQGPRAATFTFGKPLSNPAEAWFLPLTASHPESILESWSGDVSRVLKTLETAELLNLQRPRPEQARVELTVSGPGAIIVTQLADPQWQARWSGPGGTRPARIVPVFRQDTGLGWQGVVAPGPGRWTLLLDYNARDVRQGLWVSAVAGVLWMVGLVVSFLGMTRIQGAKQ